MKTVVLTLNFLFIFSGVTQLFAQDAETRKATYYIEDDLAIDGYDPVSYYKPKGPKEGKKGFSYEYKGLTYRFVNQENLDEFKESPDKFEPAYGGWCAYALAVKGIKMEPDPETFKMKNGKVLLFYNSFFNNTLPKWNEDEERLSVKADEEWEKILKK